MRGQYSATHRTFSGTETLKAESNGGLKRRATSCNGWTQPYSNSNSDSDSKRRQLHYTVGLSVDERSLTVTVTVNTDMYATR
ncbi:hypothetical protein PoB_002056600 [Plakobranchus ocellatus]|uniref:Uncharacterized protein n=1 Tax=Plakobranchus ocellatus TaxID=259542 RepID=A0AAV3ZHE5_9GAST|nr:hypothetical protein PoB_002056600 [Plakobranchus ocellatus]